ncbi:MAG: YebC/PmpR family DNA-binding transcriptional regulator [Eubacteriales bacterium]|jgi:YebC/PmpR family DNA-binding regulatory protein|nr:YebC/PmpR family DNA-binding transcriptional regulator [Bacillota bacterium]MBV1727076.1 YebC/PmpR family DNA-binding transcriptional regulator [Desulforudis sp.]MDQ7789395.1 YebC/PmpR family DNA-binding transcriptional regulator [Clostridia bacterium]MDZ4042316.1 YebC/PmpR family DNA-binding transcriptional regulator [Eubacteriales bacterium]MBU4533130.1 YebC/PmpR family DNA-binding transcriptional regulator [Bacillota bacterium]
MAGHSKWAQIKRKKAKTDAQRGKLFTKLGREIIVAAREGGGDPDGNARLKAAVQRAKEANMPNENIARAIQKGAGNLDGNAYEELFYEGYGPGGVAVLVRGLTDNRNRTSADVRHLFSKYGGNLGEAGCVAWQFQPQGVIIVDRVAAEVSEDEMTLLVLDAGADDMVTTEEAFELTTAPEELNSVRESLSNQGIEVAEAEITMVPQTLISVGDEDAERLTELVEMLEEHDDVQEVYTNLDSGE